jgi:catechol 2,3-dioxygenase-like lactoylglutathione lyase family enzyme
LFSAAIVAITGRNAEFSLEDPMALPDMVGMVVRDMGATLRFYRLLGLAIPEGVEHEQYVEVITPNGYRLSWNNLEMIKQIDPEWIEPVGQRIALAFKCASPAEVDALYEQVIAAGYAGHKAPWDAFWGQRYAVVRDPDGNTVDLFAPLGES